MAKPEGNPVASVEKAFQHSNDTLLRVMDSAPPQAMEKIHAAHMRLTAQHQETLDMLKEHFPES